jgi:hypothetical protein
VADAVLEGSLRSWARARINWSASSKESISARVLYIASDARVVAPTPRRSMIGWQQWWPVRTAIPSASSCVPRSIGEMMGSSMTKEITPALRAAVPMMRRPFTSLSRLVA